MHSLRTFTLRPPPCTPGLATQPSSPRADSAQVRAHHRPPRLPHALRRPPRDLVPSPTSTRVNLLRTFLQAGSTSASPSARHMTTIAAPRRRLSGRSSLGTFSEPARNLLHAGFRDYLRLSALSCSRFATVDKPDEGRERAAAAHARSFGQSSVLTAAPGAECPHAQRPSLEPSPLQAITRTTATSACATASSPRCAGRGRCCRRQSASPLSST